MTDITAKKPVEKQSRPVESVRPPAKPETGADKGSSKLGSNKAESNTTAPKKAGTNSTLKVALIVAAVVVGLCILGSILAGFALKGVFGEKDAKVTSKNGSITVTGKDGKATLSTSQKLPAGFPADVPVYQPSTIKFAASLAKDSYSVALGTNDSADKVTSFYDKQLAAEGWKMKENSQITFGAVTTTSYTKDKSDLTVIITGAGDAAKSTAVSLSVRTNVK